MTTAVTPASKVAVAAVAPEQASAFAGCMHDAGATAGASGGGSIAPTTAVATTSTPASKVTIGGGIAGPIDGAAQALGSSPATAPLNAMLGQLHVLLASMANRQAAGSSAAVAGANGGPTTADELESWGIDPTPVDVDDFKPETMREVTLPAPTAQTAPAAAGLQVTGATSNAGRFFAERATSSLETVGGIGISALTEAWNDVGDGERSALRGSVQTAVGQRLADLGTRVEAYAAKAPTRNELGLVQAELRSVRDLQETVGLPAQGLSGAAQATLRGVLASQVEQLEQKVQNALASRASTGAVPDAARELGVQIADLSHVIGISGDDQLRTRLDTLQPRLVALSR